MCYIFIVVKNNVMMKKIFDVSEILYKMNGHCEYYYFYICDKFYMYI